MDCLVPLPAHLRMLSKGFVVGRERLSLPSTNPLLSTREPGTLPD